jgi:N-acetylglucosaminyldiphosphoundecaprenol N-acetyl-beta-D-mannosaminyltransferase
MALTFDRGRARRLRHYLYGSDSVTLARLVERLGDDYPGAEIVGLESPPFRALTPDELEAASERLASARPHIVWVALGTPRQDDAIAALRDHVDATMVAVGAAFDFLARTKGVSPAWMQRSGLEWTFRLASEPRRLWRRYLFGNAAFVACAARGIRVLGEGPGGSNEPGPATAGGGDTDRP